MADGGPFSRRYGLGTDLLARPPPGLSPRRLRRSRRARQNAAVVCLLVIALAQRLDRVAVGGDRQNVLSAACGGIHVAGSGPGLLLPSRDRAGSCAVRPCCARPLHFSPLSVWSSPQHTPMCPGEPSNRQLMYEPPPKPKGPGRRSPRWARPPGRSWL